MMNDLVLQFQALLFTPDRILNAIAALLIVSIVGMIRGSMGGSANPIMWRLIDIGFGALGDKMNKAGRPKGDLIFRGFIIMSIVIVFAFVIAKVLIVMSLEYSTWSLVQILSLCVALSSGAVFAAIGQLYKALNKKKVTKGAYYKIARSTRTDLSKNDDYTITRVGMGYVLRSFDKSVVAPILWYLIFGLVGAYLYAALAALSWRFGKDGHSSGFGQAILSIEKLMGYVPNIISGILISFAALITPTAGMTRAFLGLARPKGQATYEEGGLPLTAAAFALNISLGGPTVDLGGGKIPRNWVGPEGATARLESAHLHRVSYISFIAHLLWLLGLGSALIFA